MLTACRLRACVQIDEPLALVAAVDSIVASWRAPPRGEAAEGVDGGGRKSALRGPLPRAPWPSEMDGKPLVEYNWSHDDSFVQFHEERKPPSSSSSSSPPPPAAAAGAGAADTKQQNNARL
jgi:hypothetical protein